MESLAKVSITLPLGKAGDPPSATLPFIHARSGQTRRNLACPPGPAAAGEKVLVAVSGGLDSMVLWRVLQELAPAHRWRLVVAHYNHGLRGAESDRDEALVRSVARRLRCPFFSERGDVATLAKERGLSIEMAARQLRHEFLARTARSQTCSSIALAHHADDQVELFFLRLLRGAGHEGLAA